MSELLRKKDIAALQRESGDTGMKRSLGVGAFVPSGTAAANQSGPAVALAFVAASVVSAAALIQSGAAKEAVDLDMKFHGAAHHTRLHGCWSILLRSRIHAFVCSRSVEDQSCMVPCISEHAAIHEAIKERDRDRAAELVAHHLYTAYERLVKIPFEEES